MARKALPASQVQVMTLGLGFPTPSWARLPFEEGLVWLGSNAGSRQEQRT